MISLNSIDKNIFLPFFYLFHSQSLFAFFPPIPFIKTDNKCLMYRIITSSLFWLIIFAFFYSDM